MSGMPFLRQILKSRGVVDTSLFWILMFWSFRNREIRKIKRNIKGGNHFAFICNDINDLEHSAQLNLPRVSVIMPLKGFGEHNLQNWRTQVRFDIFPEASYTVTETAIAFQ